MRSWSIVLQFALLGCLVVAMGCTSDLRLNNSLVNRLKDRGPVVLSQNNPFLAGNLLLNREAEQHPELQGFLAHRGTPSAMEVARGFLSPMYITLYYPDAGESYFLSETQDAWMIEGPHSIPPEKNQELAKLDSALIRAELAGQDAPTASTRPESAQAAAAPETPPYGREQANLSGQFKSFSAPAPDEATAAPAPTPGFQRSPAAADKLKSTEFEENAEISPKGDLVHYVTFPGENMAMVAKWYTYDSHTADTLARINKLQGGKLQLGDTVVIPRYLIKNKTRMTADVVKMFTLMNQKSE